MPKLLDIHIHHKSDWRAFNEARKKKSKGLSLGIPELDAQVLGLCGIVGIQGEPGACKSTLALQIAMHNVAAGVPVLMVDRENGAIRLRRRMLCNLFGVSSKMVDAASEAQFVKWYEEVKEFPFYVDTDPCQLEDVRAYLEEMRQIYEGPLLMIVDSLQALPKGDMEERIALQHWLEGLDQLKLDYKGDLTIIVTSEKKRGAYGEAAKDAGKGTNAIEYKCELLFDIRSDKNTGLLFLDLVKNRDGATFQDAVMSMELRDADMNSFVFKLSFERWGDEDRY